MTNVLSTKWMKLIFSLLLCSIVQLTGGWFTNQTVNTWYPTLTKPTGTPPAWAFPLVWTLLYLLMGFSLWLIWSKKKPPFAPTWVYLVFSIQLTLNFLWSPIFFYFQNPLLGLVDIIFLDIAIFVTIVSFWKYSHLAALLLVPYLLWVLYATRLNYGIWIMNG